jgi:hypothetical protein
MIHEHKKTKAICTHLWGRTDMSFSFHPSMDIGARRTTVSQQLPSAEQ